MLKAILCDLDNTLINFMTFKRETDEAGRKTSLKPSDFRNFRRVILYT